MVCGPLKEQLPHIELDVKKSRLTMKKPYLQNDNSDSTSEDTRSKLVHDERYYCPFDAET